MGVHTTFTGTLTALTVCTGEDRYVPVPVRDVTPAGAVQSPFPPFGKDIPERYKVNFRFLVVLLLLLLVTLHFPS